MQRKRARWKWTGTSAFQDKFFLNFTPETPAFLQVSCWLLWTSVKYAPHSVSCRFSLGEQLWFKLEMHPDVNISYSSAVPLLNNFNIKYNFLHCCTQEVCQIHICWIEFNARSNGISLQTGINLESIHVNFKRDMSWAIRTTYTIYTSSFIFQITSDKNTIFLDTRHRIILKFTYIGQNLTLFHRVQFVRPV